MIPAASRKHAERNARKVQQAVRYGWTGYGRFNRLGMRQAAGFAKRLIANIKVLVENGLDEELAARFMELLKDLTSD